MSIFTRRGRATNKSKRHLRRHIRWVSARREFKRIKRDAKKIPHLQSLIDKEEAHIRQSEQAFDADETYDAIKNRIHEYLDEEQIIREMFYFANSEEYRIIKNIEKLQEKLEKFAREHAHETTNQEEFATIERELQKTISDIYEELQTERKQARDLSRDRHKIRDQSLFSSGIIMHKLKRLSKKGKRDAKKLKKLSHKIKKTIKHIDQLKDPKQIENQIKELHQEIKQDEQFFKEEIKYLGKIEQYLIVLSFRNRPDDIAQIIKQLETTGFPQIREQELIQELTQAQAEVEKLHEQERNETNAAKKAANTVR